MMVGGLLNDAIRFVPQLPDGLRDIEQLRFALRSLYLHDSYKPQTAKRFANMLALRVWPCRDILSILRTLTPTSQCLREVLYYSLCVAEPLVSQVACTLLYPALRDGWLPRIRVNEHIVNHFPLVAKSSRTTARTAVIEAFTSAGVARLVGDNLHIEPRRATLLALAFVMHTETESVAEITQLAAKPRVVSLLWTESSVLHLLPVLAEMGVIMRPTSSSYRVRPDVFLRLLPELARSRPAA